MIAIPTFRRLVKRAERPSRITEQTPEAQHSDPDTPFDRHDPTGDGWFDEYGRECG